MLKEDDKINEVTVGEIGDPRAQMGNCYGCVQGGISLKIVLTLINLSIGRKTIPTPPQIRAQPWIGT